MYKVTISFAMDNLRTYKQGEILAEDFTTQDEITDLLQAGYIIEYDGSLEITENGTYDVSEYETAEVNVGGGGSDLSEYFVTEITSNIEGSNDTPKWLKKMPTVTIASNVNYINYLFNNSLMQSLEGIQGFGTNITMCASMFNNCKNLTSINTNNWNTSNVTSFNNMFNSCSSLQTLDLSNFDTSNATDMNAMFRYCSNLMHLDIRNFTFDNNPTYVVMFAGVPNNCEIIVKSDAEKTWITDKFSNLTNVKTVAEL